MLDGIDYDALLNIAVVIALGALALSALLVAIGVRRLARDLAALSRATERSLSIIDTELPQTLADLRATSANLRRLSEQLGPRLERVDGLLDEGAETIVALRATVEAAEDIVRGPAAAIDRTRRSVRAAGESLARGADRLRQGIEERAARRS